MSSVNELASSFVEMAKAYERLPTLETDLAEARNTISDQSATIQRLELKLIDRAQEISTLHATIRDLEVSRDDAELRFLECDDAKSTLVRVLQSIIGDAQGVLQAIAPVDAPPPAPPAEETPTVVTGTPNIDSQTNIPAEAPTAPTETSSPFADPMPSDAPSSDAGVSVPEPTSSDPVSVPAPFADATPTSPPSGSETKSAEPTATPSIDASSDPEPVKYIEVGPTDWGMIDLNPAWIEWRDRHSVAAQ